CVTPPGNMVAWWPLDETTGATVVKDIIGGNDGTPQPGAVGSGGVSPTSIAGKVGKGIYFPASNSLASVPHHPSLNFGYGGFTIDAWVYSGIASQSIVKPIVEKLDTTNTFGYGFYLQGTKLKLVMANGSGPVTFLSTDVIANNAWQHVAVTVKRTKLAAIEG